MTPRSARNACTMCAILVMVLAVWGIGGSRGQGVMTDVIDPNRGRTAIFSLFAGDTVVKNDGQYALCSANGIVWHDVNGDGMLNEDHKNQHGLSGITVQLYWLNGTLAEVTTTNTDGSYTFKVEPGTYYVKTACPKDFKHTKHSAVSDSKLNHITQKSEDFTVSIDRATTGINAGCYRPPFIEGVIFNDRDTNSEQDINESGIESISVELTKSSDSTFRLKVFTDAEGKFRFSELEPSDYKLDIIFDAKYYHSPISAHKETTVTEAGKIRRKTIPLRAAEPRMKDGKKQLVLSPLTLHSGEHATVKQGLYTLAKVEGIVFRDENANGVWDSGEDVLPSVKVTLYRAGQTPADDVVVSRMKSDEAGRYSFTELQPGQYYVAFDTSSPEYKHSSKKK